MPISIHQIKSRIKARLSEYSFEKLSKKLNFDPNEAIILSSDPRGGSTWLTQLINTIPQSAVVYEPLNLGQSPLARQLKFSWRQYIPPDAPWPEAKIMFDKIFSGKYLNNNIGYFSTISEFKNAKQIIVKFCRAHRLLYWLLNQYDFKKKPVHMFRHPLAVVASQMRHPQWDHNNLEFSFLNAPFSEYYESEKDYLLSLQTKEEGLAASWCLSNIPLLKNPSPVVYFITYEEMLLKPEEVLSNLFAQWNMQVPAEAGNLVRKKSKTTIEGSSVENPEKQLFAWKNKFTAEQLRKLKAVLDHYEAGSFYDY